jgi:hypothetical protein
LRSVDALSDVFGIGNQGSKCKLRQFSQHGVGRTSAHMRTRCKIADLDFLPTVAGPSGDLLLVDAILNNRG